MLDFDIVNDALESASAEYGAAEAHGMLCGILCAEGHQAGTRWLNELLPQPDSAGEAQREVLGQVFTDTLTALEDGQMEFMPLLPDDSESLGSRALGLGQWGNGLLYGLGVSGLGDLRDRLPENVQEIMRDFEQIAQATGEEGDPEEEEAAFAEVFEYMRVGVQLIYEELVGLRGDVAEPVKH